MKTYSLLYIACLLPWMSISAQAQTKTDTIQWWDLSTYSETTISNLTIDTDNWTPSYKSGALIRYANNVTTDGLPLKANGTIIKETDGLLFGAGIEAGSFLLRHNMGSSNNGVQMQRSKPITIEDLKAGQTVYVTLKSSSSGANGISDVTNLKGNYGSDYYTATSSKTYDFEVVADGNVSFTNSGGIVIQSIGVIQQTEDARENVAKPVITEEANHRISISCASPDATIYYSIVKGAVENYQKLYTEPFTVNRSCTVQAYAVKEGMRNSEVESLAVDVELVMPYEGRTYVLDPETLTRGAIATKTSSGMLVNWRWLITDPADISFNVYRNGTLINSSPLTKQTCWLDAQGSTSSAYTIEALSNGNVIETTNDVLVLANGYWDIPLNRPQGGTTVTGSYNYVPGDAMAADVDGDHEYEIIMKWDPDNQQDNSLSGVTGPVLIDCYKLDGTQLWRINLGQNIRAGAHYTQLMVYDLDGDGKAEVACKTAPGTIDGQGKNVLMNNDDPTADYRKTYNSHQGIVITGPEYLTVFNGETGAEITTTAYRPSRDTLTSNEWGDSYGNRCERYLACVAYLDGKHPSLVMCRGYYTASFLWAIDFDGENLETRWLHASTKQGVGAFGEGAHSLSVADVDGDGCDEIIYGSTCIDNDGDVLYRTGLGHGDALHVGDFLPDRKGLEVMMVHEETSSPYGIEMRDALSGEILSGRRTGTDVGRGLCADVDPTSRGAEYWATLPNNVVFNANGDSISAKRPSVNFRTYWDGDVQDELFEKGVISKWKSRTSSATNLVDFPSKYGAGTNLIKATPNLQCDLFGDWREEVILYDEATKSHLWIFSTPYSCNFRVPTLMHDHQYRMATVWQTAAYNQPPHVSYYMPDYVDALATSIESTSADIMTSAVVAKRYFNLCGQEIVKPEAGDGIFIEEVIYANGSIAREKKSF